MKDRGRADPCLGRAAREWVESFKGDRGLTDTPIDIHSLRGNTNVKYFNSRFLALIAGVMLMSACAPATFVRTMDPHWNTITIRRGLSADQAWDSVVDLAAKRFDIEVISKENGYLRTGWSHSWTGTLSDVYKVRAIIKFNPDKTRIEVKSEAQYLSRRGFKPGW
jgi:hypothetical protein